MIGQTVDGKYRVVRLLGRGGMGAVHEAEHVKTGERVALKCMDGALLHQDKGGMARFRREAKAMGAIDTEHMVRVLDAGTDPGTDAPYIVMELLEGEDLQHLLDRVGSLEPDIALRIAAQVCLGLQKAHEARIVHRDIKPANLFLARRGQGEIVVKIPDFGIAKIKREPDQGGSTTGLGRSGGVLGSPLYMAPEQARDLRDIDYRADLWSLGLVLYRALAGRLPHEHITGFGDLIIAICSQTPLSVQALAPWVGPEAAAVVHGALRLHPSERFPTAAAMLDAIRPLLPDGFALRQEHLVPVGEATCATRAAKLQRTDAADDTHRRPAQIASHGGGGDETMEMDAPPSNASTTSLVEPWRLIVRRPDYVIASWQQIFCTIWRRETTEESVRRVSDACAAFARQHPRGIGLLTIVEGEASLPPAPARKALAGFLAEASAFIRCSAVVLEGAGFRAAAVRSVVTGLSLVARQRFPHRVCGIEEAGRMFAEMLPAATGIAVNDAALRASLDELRAAVGRR
ncbi:serine/threonine-protein kinase [Sorangium sp. So ce1335]|uniref:serine/threonine-protein kinase n=1 Tax=Sorangium sp. So ce1335 TaxID=3133335 RepID=UPI003F5D6D64